MIDLTEKQTKLLCWLVSQEISSESEVIHDEDFKTLDYYSVNDEVYSYGWLGNEKLRFLLDLQIRLCSNIEDEELATDVLQEIDVVKYLLDKMT